MKKTKEFIKKYTRWIIAFICLLIFITFAENVFNKEMMQIDVLGYSLINEYLISNISIPIARFITEFGGAKYLVSFAIISLLIIDNKKIGTSISLNLIISTFLNIILKNILQRPRPDEYRIIDETGYSFPSGHSMVSLTFYGLIIYFIYKYIKNKKIKIPLIIVLSLLIISIGISRIYLGVHYTSDVLAGFLIGISYLIIFIGIMENYNRKSLSMKLRRKRIIKVKTKKLVNSFKYAIEGLISSFKTERNMKIHIFVMLLVILAGIILKISKIEWIICLILFSLVIAGELFNTAIETVVDLAMPHKNEKAKLAKDVSAAAVLVLAIFSAIIGLIIFIPKFI